MKLLWNDQYQLLKLFISSLLMIFANSWVIYKGELVNQMKAIDSLGVRIASFRDYVHIQSGIV